MYTYELNLKWSDKRKGILSSPILLQNIEVATPPEFPKGMEKILSIILFCLAILSRIVFRIHFRKNIKLY